VLASNCLPAASSNPVARASSPPGPASPGAGRPLTLAGDYFTVWDGLAVWPDGRRFLCQVTVADCVSERRRKILASGFPVNADDLLLGYVEGRGRHFRVYPGPEFNTVTEEWVVSETAAPVADREEPDVRA